jgi:hypothetical protein
MAKRRLIPEKLLPELVKMNVIDGILAPDLVIWLKNTHDITVNDDTVSATIRNYRKISNEVKRVAIAEAAARSAIDCVGIMEANITLLNAEAIKLLTDSKLSNKLAGKQLADTLLKYIDKKMALTHIGEHNVLTNKEEQLVEGLLAKLGVKAAAEDKIDITLDEAFIDEEDTFPNNADSVLEASKDHAIN